MGSSSPKFSMGSVARSFVAKRFTDTDKWKREWFHDLPVKAKLAWLYLTDNCDHRGVWFSNFSLLSSQLGTKVTRAEFEKWFKGKVREFDGDKYLILSFATFQYGELNANNNAHKAVIQLLEKLGPDEGLASLSEGAQDKDKDKDKENSEEGSGEKQTPKFDFESVYAAYPRKEGKKVGLTKLKALVRSQAEFDELMAGTKRFAYLSRSKKPEYIPLFSTFVEQQRWLDSVPHPATSALPTMPNTPLVNRAFEIEPPALVLSADELAERKREVAKRFGRVQA